jgi:protein-tyrosine phosphatase
MRVDLYTVKYPPYGDLSIMARPRGNDWLAEEIQALCNAHVDVVVSLLTLAEQWELSLTEEQQICQEQGLIYKWFPIPDRGTPLMNQETFALINELAQLLKEGKHIAIHCFMGIGRSTMIAASVLTRFGVCCDEAFTRLAIARGCKVPDTDQQRQWVEEFLTFQSTYLL